MLRTEYYADFNTAVSIFGGIVDNTKGTFSSCVGVCVMLSAQGAHVAVSFSELRPRGEGEALVGGLSRPDPVQARRAPRAVG